MAALLVAEKRVYSFNFCHTLSGLVASEMSLPPSIIDGLRFATQIHDIGKISISSDILTKPTALSSMEIAILLSHSQ